LFLGALAHIHELEVIVIMDFYSTLSTVDHIHELEVIAIMDFYSTLSIVDLLSILRVPIGEVCILDVNIMGVLS